MREASAMRFGYGPHCVIEPPERVSREDISGPRRGFILVANVGLFISLILLT